MAAFILSGFITVFVYELSRALFAKIIGFDLIVHHNHVYMQQGELYAHWNKPTMFFYHTSGMIGAFLLSFAFLAAYRTARKKSGPRRLVYLWGIIHSANLSISYFMVGTLSSFMSEMNEINMAFLFNYLQFSGELRSMFVVINVICLLILGILIIKPAVLQAHNHYVIRKNAAVRMFLFFKIVLPWFVGGLFLMLVRLPFQNKAELYTYLLLGIIIMPSLFFRAFTGQDFSLSKIKLVKQRRVNRVYILLLILAILLPLITTLLTLKPIAVDM